MQYFKNKYSFDGTRKLHKKKYRGFLCLCFILLSNLFPLLQLIICCYVILYYIISVFQAERDYFTDSPHSTASFIIIK